MSGGASAFEAVIGLEVHVQMSTRTKIFCGCPTTFGAAPNSQVCPVCLGLPGALPVMNGRVLELATRAAAALHGEIQPWSAFDRKNYFYPDLPKNYQTTQYHVPFSLGGYLEIPSAGMVGPKRIRLNRLHLEEDAGKLIHKGRTGQISEGKESLADLNRTGVPLMEIVSEPDVRSAEEASEFLIELRTIMRYAEVSECNMEEGSLRCDANVSLRPMGTEAYGKKVEVKNLNSFKFVREAIDHEIARQTAILAGGGTVVQETRLWDSGKKETSSMRSKEQVHDYRYFPEPDLVPLHVEAGWVKRVISSMPEMPAMRRQRYRDQYGLSAYDAGVVVAERALSDYVERVIELFPQAKTAVNWITQSLLGALNAEGLPIDRQPVTPDRLAAFLKLLDAGTISGKQGKDVLVKMVKSGKAADAIVKEDGLAQVLDVSAVTAWVDQAIQEFPKSVEDVRQGKTQAVGFLVGQVMKKSGGKANPGVVNQVLKQRLNVS